MYVWKFGVALLQGLSACVNKCNDLMSRCISDGVVAVTSVTVDNDSQLRTTRHRVLYASWIDRAERYLAYLYLKYTYVPLLANTKNLPICSDVHTVVIDAVIHKEHRRYVLPATMFMGIHDLQEDTVLSVLAEHDNQFVHLAKKVASVSWGSHTVTRFLKHSYIHSHCLLRDVAHTVAVAVSTFSISEVYLNDFGSSNAFVIEDLMLERHVFLFDHLVKDVCVTLF